MSELITGPWKLKDLREGRIGAKPNGFRVLSTFSCGGGSSMGYKLAGFEVVGGIEIDPEMAGLYRLNHSPKYMIEAPIQEFNKKLKEGDRFDAEVDILDGSPPCSAFSIAAFARETRWGKHLHFKEGQAKQVLTDLFFHFIETARLLNPKIVIAENVKGMLAANAKGYARRVVTELNEIGYDVQVFRLNAAHMGVPQKRERVFFIGRRRDLKIPPFKMDFDEKPITPAVAFRGLRNQTGKPLEQFLKGSRQWCVKRGTDEVQKWAKETTGKFKYYSLKLVLPNLVAKTQRATSRLIHWEEDRYLSDLEVVRLQTFPDDYDFSESDPGYVCGMSVPPLMMMRLALRVGEGLMGVPPVTKLKTKRPK